MAGREWARRLCQAAIGAFIDWRKAGYDLARDATGEQFDRLFADPRSRERRLLDAAFRDFDTSDLADAAAGHLTAVVGDLLLRHGLVATELADLAEPDLPHWADRAMQAVCARGLRPSAMPGLAPSGRETSGDNPLVEVDQGLERRLKVLVARVYRQLLANLDTDLQVAFFGRLLLDVGELKAVVGETRDDVRQIRDDVGKLVRPPDSPPPFTIPQPVADFTGYEAEIERVCAALANGSAAISAVQGIGGVGKTELARKVAALMRADFPDGQILVEMLGTTQPRNARDAMTDVLAELGELDSRPDSLAGQYQSRLAGKRLLILLDNVASRAGLAELVPPAPAALLVTSRTRLALPGVVPVELEKLSRGAAKALLAGMVPSLDDAVLDELAGLCADLPLALRVAGSYLQETDYPAPNYVAELKERRLARLARSAVAIEDARLNPEIVLGHSYDRLAEADADVARSFTMLGVFPDDFELAGAAAVLEVDENAARERLTLLRRRSLVQQPEAGERWRLHDLLRELAEARAEPAERDAAAARHRDYYLELLNWCVDEHIVRRIEVRRALATFEAERPNVTSAIDQAMAGGSLQAAARAHLCMGPLDDALGRREDGLADSEAAVALYRRLAADQPDAFKPDLATSLNNLGIGLDGLGRHEDALTVTEEAVGLYRCLVANRPDTFKPSLAMGLTNLGNRFDALRRREDALAATEEAVKLYRSLAADRPDAFNPDLAMCLSNLGNMRGALNQVRDALAATEASIELYRGLAAERPDVFDPELARSLYCMGHRLNAIGRPDDALAAAEEAVAMRRRLAADRPDAFNPDLALSLAFRADCLEGLQQMGEALASDVEAIEKLRPTFLRLPQAMAHWMGRICSRYVERCQKLGVEPDTALLGPIIEVFQRLGPPRDRG